MIVVHCLLTAKSLVTSNQKEKDSKGIKVLYPKVQSFEFVTTKLLLLILKYPDTSPFSLFGIRWRNESSCLE